MITTFQVIIILFALFALSRAILRLKDNQISSREFFFWSVIWVFVILFSFIPDVLGIIAKYFGIGRGIDLLTMFGMIFLFYLMFKIFVKIETVQHEITTLTRNIAIQNAINGKNIVRKNKIKKIKK